MYEKKYSSVNGRETQIYAETFLREIDALQLSKSQFTRPLVSVYSICHPS